MASLGAYLEALAIQRKFPHLRMLSDPFDWIHFLLEELVGSMVWWEQILKTAILLLENPIVCVCKRIFMHVLALYMCVCVLTHVPTPCVCVLTLCMCTHACPHS